MSALRFASVVAWLVRDLIRQRHSVKQLPLVRHGEQWNQPIGMGNAEAEFRADFLFDMEHADCDPSRPCKHTRQGR